MARCILCTAIFQSLRGDLFPSADKILPERTLRFCKCDDTGATAQVKNWHRHYGTSLDPKIVWKCVQDTTWASPAFSKPHDRAAGNKKALLVRQFKQATIPLRLWGGDQTYCHEYRPDGAGEGNRTLLRSLEGYCITTMLRPPLGRRCHTPVFDVSARGECRK